jgi:hypothetical protein
VSADLSTGILTYSKRGDDMAVQNCWPTSPAQTENATVNVDSSFSHVRDICVLSSTATNHNFLKSVP